MNQITKDLKDTLRACPYIETIYFDAKGSHYFVAHEHNGERYTKIRNQTVTDRSVPNARPKRIIEAKEEDRIVDILSRNEVLSSPVISNDAPQDSNSINQLEAMQNQLAIMKAEVEKAKAVQKELDDLKAANALIAASAQGSTTKNSEESENENPSTAASTDDTKAEEETK